MQVFSVLSSESRRKMLEKILSSEQKCSSLEECFNLDISTISRHLHALEKANLIVIEKQGKYIKLKTKNKSKVMKFLALAKELEDSK
ncbi:MAG: helix-turn-helix transcriptional regulator [Candidatus Diapherotrites archaeon]|nr:helix-turn-helix transcriptional regulator [Candidatus Diapherotrites archaeon]